MARRTPARLLAPLALVTVAAALFIVVSNGSDPGPAGEAPAPPSRSTTTGAQDAKSTSSASRTRGRRSYTVRAGDTPSGIAEKTGVPVERLLELNPDLDAQSLSVGQRLKLR